MAAVMAGSAVAMLASGPATADVKTGVDAWQRGDFRAAVEQWRPLAISGDADAQFNLAQAYKLGRGVPLDPVLAESWFRKAAMQGHIQAQDNYGLALFQNNKKEEAVPWLEKSISRDEPRAELVLGTMLFNGDGVPREYPRAYALMTRASQQGLKSASETLAQMDQYVSPADRERGTTLAAQYASHAKSSQIASVNGGMQVTDLPPSQVDAQQASRDARQPRGEQPRGEQPGPSRDAAPSRDARADMPPPRMMRGDGAPRPDAKPPRSAGAPAAPPPRAARNDAPPPERAARERPPVREAAAPRMTGKGWRVQLGAFAEPGNARNLWGRLSSRFAGVDAAYVKAGRVTRLQAGPYRSRAEAQRACAAARVSCVVIAP